MYRRNLLENGMMEVLVFLPIINLFLWLCILGRRLAELEMHSMLAHVRKEMFFTQALCV